MAKKTQKHPDGISKALWQKIQDKPEERFEVFVVPMDDGAWEETEQHFKARGLVIKEKQVMFLLLDLTGAEIKEILGFNVMVLENTHAEIKLG